jgi:hypothetical protein
MAAPGDDPFLQRAPGQLVKVPFADGKVWGGEVLDAKQLSDKEKATAQKLHQGVRARPRLCALPAAKPSCLRPDARCAAPLRRCGRDTAAPGARHRLRACAALAAAVKSAR